MRSIENQLREGRPNSLGNTVAVVDQVLEDPSRFEELFQCYFSEDEWVRLRVSNAMKRICKQRKDLLVPYLDLFINEISQIDQASAQWTIAQLFKSLGDEMTAEQLSRSKAHLCYNVAHHTDWIVLNMTMETLAEWAMSDIELKDFLIPHLRRLSGDPRKSVASKASKKLVQLQQFS